MNDDLWIDDLCAQNIWVTKQFPIEIFKQLPKVQISSEALNFYDWFGLSGIFHYSKHIFPL